VGCVIAVDLAEVIEQHLLFGPDPPSMATSMSVATMTAASQLWKARAAPTQTAMLPA
jgi:hypothetical protein